LLRWQNPDGCTAIKYILIKYLSRQVNPPEVEAVEDWLNDTKNMNTSHQWLLEWETIIPQFVPDQQLAMTRLLSRIYDNELKGKDSIRNDSQRKL